MSLEQAFKNNNFHHLLSSRLKRAEEKVRADLFDELMKESRLLHNLYNNKGRVEVFSHTNTGKTVIASDTFQMLMIPVEKFHGIFENKYFKWSDLCEFGEFGLYGNDSNMNPQAFLHSIGENLSEKGMLENPEFYPSHILCFDIQGEADEVNMGIMGISKNPVNNSEISQFLYLNSV